ncbi:MAG: hypothetical protein H7A33_00820 [Deltaproteobacteria bacterium]|nr:hypothetical protein [Deltaproteobacteria bacterium]
MFEQLPEPPRPVFNKTEKRERNHQFAKVLNYFVLGYNILHKLIMPLYVGWTRKSVDPTGTDVDFWWLFHVLIAVLLNRKKWDDALLRFTCVVGIGSSFYQLVFSMYEFHTRVMSYWLTAGATLSVVIFILSISKIRHGVKKETALIVAGILAGLTLQFFLLSRQEINRWDNWREAHKAEADPATIVLQDSSSCGGSGFSFVNQGGQLTVPQTETIQKITIETCGLSPKLAYFDASKGLDFSNNTNVYMNIKVSRLQKNLWKSFKNIPLRPHTAFHFSPEKINAEIMVLYSDAHPEMGLLLLLPTPHSLDEFVQNQQITEPYVVVDRLGIFGAKSTPNEEASKE